MLRTLMAAGLTLAIAAPAGAADWRRYDRPGDGGAGVSGGADTAGRANVGSGIIRGHRDRPDRPRRWYKPPTVIYVVPRDTTPEPPAATPAPPAPPPPEAEVEDAEPLDPRGGHRRHLARGAKATDPDWRAGQVLPPDLPYVKLAPESYGLPEAPQGRIFVRVRRAVLLIDPVSRVIEEVIGD